jgi:hypothetical protein
MPITSLQENLQLAAATFTYLKRVLPLGSTNRVGDAGTERYPAAVANLKKLNADFNEEYESCMSQRGNLSNMPLYLLEYRAAVALNYGVGNCDEQAAVAFRYLKEIAPGKQINIVQVCNHNDGSVKHAMILIGAPHDPAAVVLDGHEQEYYEYDVASRANLNFVPAAMNYGSKLILRYTLQTNGTFVALQQEIRGLMTPAAAPVRESLPESPRP